MICSDEGELLPVYPRPRLEMDIGLVGLLDDREGEGLVLTHTVPAKLVGTLPVRNLVVPEPLHDPLQLSGKVPEEKISKPVSSHVVFPT